jgi:hypothetical protein
MDEKIKVSFTIISEQFTKMMIKAHYCPGDVIEGEIEIQESGFSKCREYETCYDCLEDFMCRLRVKADALAKIKQLGGER